MFSIIPGGLGGMGMDLINWLINRGGRKIVIACHKNDPQGSKVLRINRWKKIGANIVVVKVDISKSDHVEKLLNEANSLGSVCGIFNLAAVSATAFIFTLLINNCREKNFPVIFAGVTG